MKPRLLISIIAVVALIIAGAAVIILAANQPPRAEQSYYPRPTRDPSLPPECLNRIEIQFRTDAEMLKASNELESDTRFYNVTFLTQAQNYEQLKRTFAGQPELLALLRPESVPATASLMLSYSSQKRMQIDSLKQQYGPANVADPCDLPTSSTRRAPTTTAVTR